MSDDSKPSNAELPVASLLCQYCEADLPVGSEACLRCGIASGNTPNPYGSPTARVINDIAEGTNGAGTLTSILLTGALLVLLVVVGFESPGVAIFLGVFTIPPWIRTALVMRRRSATGLETSTAASVSLFVGSLLVTWLILFSALVCCTLTFCFACIGALTMSRDERVVFPMAGIAALAVFLGIVLVFSPWIRSRFRRDTTRK